MNRNEEKRILEDLLLRFCAAKGELHTMVQTYDLTCFSAQKGRKYKEGGLMIVGRQNFKSKDAKLFRIDDLTPEDCGHLAEHAYLQNHKKFPSRKVGKKLLNSSNSWIITREIVSQVYGTKHSDKWASYILWSNLFKVTRNGRNTPGALAESLCRKPFFDCYVDLLKAEISKFKPNKIVFLTCWKWAKDFIEQMTDKSLVMRENRKCVAASGVIEMEDLDVTPDFVVARYHPQAAQSPQPEEVATEIHELLYLKPTERRPMPGIRNYKEPCQYSALA